MALRGNIRLQDLSVRSLAGKDSFALDRLMLAGNVESRLDGWERAAFTVRDGVTRWATLRYRNHALDNLNASWRIDGQKLVIDRLAAQIFGGHISGLLTLDLVTHAIPHCEFQIKGINMHAALANISPQHLDAEGNASGLLHLALSEAGELSGGVELAFDGPGLLRIGEIEEVKRMLVGNVGLALAMLALDDLKQYPFKEGRLHLESSGTNAQLKVAFVRQPRSQADVTPPHKEIINGQEVWVGSLVVPTIDLTVPITGKSLAEILSIVGGIRPLNEAVHEQHGK
ncbi:MAG: intermembrane phospholipid transport protein YdbH family protein [Candidatus Entotheonellia bacterium]